MCARGYTEEVLEMIGHTAPTDEEILDPTEEAWGTIQEMRDNFSQYSDFGLERLVQQAEELGEGTDEV
jgi:hypothetical protein